MLGIPLAHLSLEFLKNCCGQKQVFGFFLMCVCKDKWTSLCRVTFYLVYYFSAQRAEIPMATPDSLEHGIATQT